MIKYLYASFSNRIIRFIIIGGVASASYLLLGFIFVLILDLPVLLGNALAYLLSFAISFFGHSLWIFNSRESVKNTLPRFAIIQFFGLIINTATIKFLTANSMPYEFAMLAAIILVSVITYISSKKWAFQK